MKGSRLISEILKGEWLIDVQNLEAYHSIVNKVLSGDAFNFKTEPKSILSIIDSNGKKVLPDSNGKKIAPKNSIAVVKMVGEVIKNGDYCIYGADEIVAALTSAENNPNIIGTVLNIDGPGGAVSAIGLFQDFAKNVKTKPIVGLCDSALSLHYWTAVEVCDHIMAENDVSARFGSVGVMLTFADNRKVLEEKGYKFHEIYPKESEHKNLAFKLAREEKYEMIKDEFLSPLAKKFQERVQANRPNLKTDTVGLLTGKTFFADDALANGMIDSIGGQKQALNLVKVLSAINN